MSADLNYDADNPYEVESVQAFALDRALTWMAEWENSNSTIKDALVAAQAYAAIALAAGNRLIALGGIPDDPPSLCFDCEEDVTPGNPGDGNWQWYMVRDEVWAAALMTPSGGFLCLDCLEKRLGRGLDGSDFKLGLPINEPDPETDTPRLLELKTAAQALRKEAV